MSAYRMEENLCELALERVIKSIAGPQIQGLQVLRRGSVEQQMEPYVTIFASACEDDSHQVGNVNVEIEIEGHSHYKDHTIEQHDAFMGAIRDILWAENFLDLLNEAMADEPFTAIAWTRRNRSNSRDGHSFVTKQLGTLFMFPGR